LVTGGLPGVRDHPLASVRSIAAAAYSDEHDEAAQDFQDAANVAKDDAVAHSDVGGWSRDVGDDVRVPSDGDDRQHTGAENQEAAEASHGPVRPLPPAPHTWDCNGNAN